MTVSQNETRNDRFHQFPDSGVDFEKRLDERFSRIEEQFALIASQIGKKSQCKGKRLQKPQPSSSAAAASRLRSYMHDLTAASTSRASSEIFTEDEDRPLRPRSSQNQTSTTKTIFIQKIDCFINNTPIDQGMLKSIVQTII